MKTRYMKKGLALCLGLAAIAGPARATLITELGILDLTANGGINPATGAAWKGGDTYRFAFITSGTTLATSTNIDDYNAFVQAQAAASTSFSNLGTATWKIIGATDTTDVFSNTGTTTSGGESVFLLNNELFATNYADLWDGTAENRLDRDQNGDARPKDSPIWTQWNAVWTGLNGDASTSGNPLGNNGDVRHGLMSAESNFWINRSSNSGSTYSLAVYALSAPLTIVPEPSTMILLGTGLLGLLARPRRSANP